MYPAPCLGNPTWQDYSFILNLLRAPNSRFHRAPSSLSFLKASSHIHLLPWKRKENPANLPQIRPIWVLGPVQNPTNPWADPPAGRLALSSEFVANCAGNRSQPILGPNPQETRPAFEPPHSHRGQLRASPAPTRCLGELLDIYFANIKLFTELIHIHTNPKLKSSVCSKFTGFTVLLSGLFPAPSQHV